MAKKKMITRPQLAGVEGQSIVSARSNDMGFLFTPYGPLEAGIDGLIELRDPVSGQVSGQLVAVQVKTTDDGRYSNETAAGFDYLLDPADTEYWRGSNLPVILVVVHLGRREAFWKDTSTGDGPQRRRLKFDRSSDRFDKSARDRIAGLCVSKSQWGVWFPPMKGVETGHVNLIEVELPDAVFSAPSPFKTGRQALEELLTRDDNPPDDWVIRGGQFLSFRDPRHTSLEHILDEGSVEEIGREEIAFPEDEADEHTIIELLRRTLSAQLDGTLAYDRKRRIYYFPAKLGAINQSYAYQSLKVQTSADVVKRYEKDGKTLYVRHHAFEPRFWRHEDHWYLSVTPTFKFTWDGFKPDRFEAGRLSGKKKLEVNSSLLGQFVMWRHLLTQSERDSMELFGSGPPNQALLRFHVIDGLSLERAVPDELWRSSEPANVEDERQSRFAI